MTYQPPEVYDATGSNSDAPSTRPPTTAEETRSNHKAGCPIGLDGECFACRLIADIARLEGERDEYKRLYGIEDKASERYAAERDALQGEVEKLREALEEESHDTTR